jgi:tRNA-uridine 2-sulfurtransferase
MKKVVVGMSGGVDSSVAASLLVENGYAVEGVTLQTWEAESDETASKKWQERGCCKVGIARYVAERLGIPHRIIDIRERFRSAVIQDFIDGYRTGRTPNPCVRCNERVKFLSLMTAAEESGAEYVATGHYGRVSEDAGRWQMYKAEDPAKDQSYFLYRLNRAWLPRILLPIGSLRKDQVWDRAEALGLPVEEIQESQEICFVTKGDYRRFLSEQAPEVESPGAFVGVDGTTLGTHRGAAFYTPGQRRGLGIASSRRLYVVSIDAPSNSVVLGDEKDLLTDSCTLEEVNLLDELDRPVKAWAKIRYASPAVPVLVAPCDSGGLGLHFEAPQRAVSPGQSAVLYQGARVLGGGIIARTA